MRKNACDASWRRRSVVGGGCDCDDVRKAEVAEDDK